ncbi:MAG: ATP:cob(I)alamin adenosyltransferase, partial [Patescibacteria group bacterium]
MALYTRKGDGGTTKIFGCDQKLSKSSAVAEALGAMDELNSLLGFCKVKSQKVKVKPKSLALVQVLEQ